MDDNATYNNIYNFIRNVKANIDNTINLPMKNGLKDIERFIRTNNINGIKGLLRTKKLRKYNINNGINNHNDSPLIVAAEVGKINMVKLLHSINPKFIDARNFMDRTALTYACDNGNMEVVEFLISEGADVSIIDCEKLSLTHIVCRNGHLNVLKKLISSGAPFDTIEYQKFRPIDHACMHNRIEIVEYLLTNVYETPKIGLNEDTTIQFSLFQLACFNKLKNMALMLLLYGANLNKLENKCSAIQIALIGGDKDIIKLVYKFTLNTTLDEIFTKDILNNILSFLI